jgi:ferredoxin
MRYNFPSMPYWSGKLKAVLGAYRQAGGVASTIMLHNPGDGAELLRAVELPEDVLPLEIFHVAAIGLDWLLGALSLGAGRVIILTAGSEAPQYLVALREQIALAEDILDGLGYGRGHFHLFEVNTPAALPQAFAKLPPAMLSAPPASFDWFDNKRTTLDFCIAHFVSHAPAAAPDSIALPTGAPFGTVAVDAQSCTLCLSCVSACPAQALQDGGGEPLLRFVERNCVQCGLCENACPEHAISLQPRLLLTAESKQPRVLHQDQPFHCVRCGKPFATTHMIGSILHKLHGHSMFATPEARRRLQMCGDCRVIDMIETGDSMAGSLR